MTFVCICSVITFHTDVHLSGKCAARTSESFSIEYNAMLHEGFSWGGLLNSLYLLYILCNPIRPKLYMLWRSIITCIHVVFTSIEGTIIYKQKIARNFGQLLESRPLLCHRRGKCHLIIDTELSKKATWKMKYLKWNELKVKGRFIAKMILDRVPHQILPFRRCALKCFICLDTSDTQYGSTKLKTV